MGISTATGGALAAALFTFVNLLSTDPSPATTRTATSLTEMAYSWVAVSSTAETVPVATSGDAADDPAIWVHPTSPRLSLVIGNNKHGAIESYRLDGSRVQRISPAGFVGNVDVRGNLVAAARDGIRVYAVTPSTQEMKSATEGGKPIPSSGEGLCMYDPGSDGPSGGLFVFTITRDKGRVREYALHDDDGDGLVTGSLVRDFTIGSESEGCVADDSTGSLFVSEEDEAVWRYGAATDDGNARSRVAAVNSALPADAEGLAIAADFLLVSAQNVAAPNQNFVNVYDRRAPYAFVGRVRVAAGSYSDDCDRTDGIAAYAGNLGPEYPAGIFVCQDGNNGAPGSNGYQNFKLSPLDQVLAL